MRCRYWRLYTCVGKKLLKHKLRSLVIVAVVVVVVVVVFVVVCYCSAEFYTFRAKHEIMFKSNENNC